ncbi:MAG TPA: hypothetical protein VKX17_22190 [Planctomycetota bacterium]|nr:hypothetical protein [Planctomycetota bacterium]
MVCVLLPAFYAGLIYAAYRCLRWWIRRRFRVHLSTLVVLTILTGALVGLNVRPIRNATQIGLPFMPTDPEEDGWADMAEFEEQGIREEQRAELFKRYYGFPILLHNPMYDDKDDDPVGAMEIIFLLPINLALMFGMVTLAAFLLERKSSAQRDNTTLTP